MVQVKLRRAVVLATLLLCVGGNAYAQGGGLSWFGFGRSKTTTVVPVTITTAPTLPDGTQGTVYTSTQLASTGGTGPYTYANNGGGTSLNDADSDCAGLALSSGGLITGTPTKVGGGVCNFTVIATDSLSAPSSATAFVITVAASGGGSLSSPWDKSYIGNGITATGTCTNASTIYSMTGDGDNYGTSDTGLEFCYQPVTGDKEIIVQVSSCASDGVKRCGVMIRASLSATSANMAVFTQPAGGLQVCHSRATTSAVTIDEGGAASDSYLKLTNIGGSVTCYRGTSSSGPWTAVGSAHAITLSSTYYIGMFCNNANTPPAIVSCGFTSPTVQTATAPSGTDYGGYRPHYQGFAYNATGGRGDTTKVICVVTTLSDTTGDPSDSTRNGVAVKVGSFRQCALGSVDTSYIVFEVGGNIQLDDADFRFNHPNLTIAGQTAPSPGISFTHAVLVANVPNIVFQHIRIRCGAAAGNNAAEFYISGTQVPVYNIVVDHVSVAFCPHEGIGMNIHSLPAGNSTQPQDVLIVDSLIGANLRGVAGNISPVNLLYYGAENGTLTMARNALIHGANRNPQLGSGVRAAVYNNLVYNARIFSGGMANSGNFGFVQLHWYEGNPNLNPLELQYIGNVNLAGPATLACDGTFQVSQNATQVANAPFLVYLQDNVGCGMTNTGVANEAGQWAGVTYYQTGVGGQTNVASESNTKCVVASGCDRTWFTNVNYDIMASSAVKTYVMANAGARPTDRDSLDTTLIANVNSSPTAGPTDTDMIALYNESYYGGFPAIGTGSNTFIPPANPHTLAACSGAWTTTTLRSNLECDLENAARALEPAR